MTTSIEDEPRSLEEALEPSRIEKILPRRSYS